MNRYLAIRYRDGILLAGMRDRETFELSFERPGEERRVGDILLGRITEVRENLNAAFAELSPGEKAYLPYRPGHAPKPGAILPLQLDCEPVKTKLPTVTAGLTLTGRYLVLLTGKKGVALSHRLNGIEERERLKALLAPEAEEQGFIIRTCAKGADDETLLREAAALKEKAAELFRAAEHRPCYAVLKRGLPRYLDKLRSLSRTEAEEIVTDDAELYEQIRNAAEDADEAPALRLYRDEQLPLIKLYSLETAVEEALGRRVWLRSGGYLVIEQTEALVSVDVNTGKNEGRASFAETVLKTNLEAASETARQLRLRNLSGMILVDFIRMKDEADRLRVQEVLEKAVAEDPVRVTVEGYSRLGLMEMTRRRERGTLQEQLRAK